MQKTIIIDMDSTLVDLLPTWLDEYNLQTGDNLNVEELTTFDIHNHARCGRVVYEPLKRKGFFSKLPPMPGSIVAVKDFIDAGHEVLIASASLFAPNFTDKIEWIQRNIPFIPLENVALFSKKHRLSGDVLIDDAPHIVQAFRQTNPQSFIVGIEYPYNKENRLGFDNLVKDHVNPAQAWAVIKNSVLGRLEMK